jgi:phosphonate transport system substrate-binding protein
MRSTLILGAALALALLSARGLAQEPDPNALPLSFGLYQSDKPTVMYKKFMPVLEYLQGDLERRLRQPVDIRLEIFRSYDDGIDALVAGKVDFVRFGPSSYITAQGRNKEIRLLAMEHEKRQKRFKGLIIVAKSSPIRSLADLRGKSFAFGDPNSTIGRWLVQAELAKAGIRSDDLSSFAYLPRHDAVARAVQMGDFDAGSVKEGTFEELAQNGDLRILMSFDNVTKPWIARAGLEGRVADALKESLFSLTDAAVLKELKVSGFAATSDEEYQLVREGMKLAEAFQAGRGDN